MVRVIVFLALACFAQANTCSSFVIDQITHNTLRATFQNNELTSQAQIQYGPTSAYGSTQGDIATLNVAGGTARIMTLTGIAPNTTYHFAAQSFNGTAWCPAIDQTATTLTSPPHPILPTPPATFSVSAPAAATGIIHAVSPLTCSTLYPGGFTSATWGGASCQNETSLLTAIRASTNSGVCNATYGDLVLLSPGTIYSYSGATPGTTLTLCDAPDAAQITSFAAATGVWTTAAAHGLSVGNQVILGFGYISDDFAESNDDLPYPFNPGYAYYVQSVPTSTTFTVSNTNGGALVTGLTGTDFSAPVYGCLVKGADVPAESEIIIRSATPDSQIAPFGVTVFTDANLNVLNPGAFATIRTSGQAGSAVRLDMGCLAHHYRFLDVKWDYAPVGTVNELDGPAYSQFVNSSAANRHITFDRNWVHGGLYPERDYKWCLACDGYYIGLLNSVIENLNFWTPAWSSTPIALTSGTVITIPTGNVYFGNGVSDKLALSSGATLRIAAGTVSGNAVFEADRGGFYLTVPNGITATCSVPGQTCTVTNVISPAYAQSGGVYTRVDIANPAISAGSWAAVNENSPPTLSLPGGLDEEGATVFAIDRGPGPYLVQGNLFHNDPGISFYVTSDYSGFVDPVAGDCAAVGVSGCPWLSEPGDLSFIRNTFLIDPGYIANESNAAWSGRFYSMRQHFEWKTSQRSRVAGNIFSGSFCANYSGRGVNIALTDHGAPSRMTSSDHEIAFNTFEKACQGFQFVGGNSSGGSGPTDNPINSQRIWFHDNVVTHINRYQNTTFNTYGAPGDNGTMITFNMGPQDMTLEHNLFDINQGTSPSNNFDCNLAEGFVFRNNIVGYSNDDNLNDWWYEGCGGVPNPAPPASAAAVVPVVAPNNFIWNNILFFGGYSNSLTGVEMNSSYIAAQAALWNSLPTTTFAPGNTIAARAAGIGFSDYNTGAYQLASGSPYVSGGASHASDGLDLGPDTLNQCVQQGCVQNVRARSISATSAIVSFVAPDSYGCTVDVSANGLATFTRVSNAGGSRVQDVPLTGLTPSTGYTYRVNCAVQQPAITFTTTP